MRAVTWHGKRDVRVDTVPDPTIVEPTDAVIRLTSTAICGSDLHLYEVLGPFMSEGDNEGRRPRRDPVPDVLRALLHVHRASALHPVRDDAGTRAGLRCALFGYSKLYGSVPGGQAEYLRVPQAQFTHVKVPDGPPDERFLYLSDVVPTAWQAVEYAAVPKGGTVVVLGLGPIGDMAARVALHRDAGRVIGVDLVPERLARAKARGVETVDLRDHPKDLGDAIRDMTDGRGPDAVIDAVGLEAHGSPVAKAVQTAAGMLPDAIAAPIFKTTGVEDFATHRLPLEDAPGAYKTFQKKQDGMVKVVLNP